jgi:hypothetical protein
MPTSLPRLALTRDPELEDALRRARLVLGDDRSAASVARELILRGARDLVAPGSPELDAWLTRLGATQATGTPVEVIAEAAAMPDFDPADPWPASRALQELRADSV